jgi:hypothetical protein
MDNKLPSPEPDAPELKVPPKKKRFKTGEYQAIKRTTRKVATILGALLGGSGLAAGGVSLHGKIHEHIDVSVYERTAVLEAKYTALDSRLQELEKQQKSDTEAILQAIQAKR